MKLAGEGDCYYCQWVLLPLVNLCQWIVVFATGYSLPLIIPLLEASSYERGLSSRLWESMGKEILDGEGEVLLVLEEVGALDCLVETFCFFGGTFHRWSNNIFKLCKCSVGRKFKNTSTLPFLCQGK